MYGKENFIKEIIEFCNDLYELDEREVFWIKEFNSNDRNIGYNLTLGGHGFKCKHTEITKRKISESGKISQNRDDVKLKKSNSLIGKNIQKKQNKK